MASFAATRIGHCRKYRSGREPHRARHEPGRAVCGGRSAVATGRRLEKIRSRWLAAFFLSRPYARQRSDIVNGLLAPATESGSDGGCHLFTTENPTHLAGHVAPCRGPPFRWRAACCAKPQLNPPLEKGGVPCVGSCTSQTTSPFSKGVLQGIRAACRALAKRWPNAVGHAPCKGLRGIYGDCKIVSQ